MHQLNIRVDDALFRELRTAYAHEIERRVTRRHLSHLPWSGFVRECLSAGLDVSVDLRGLTRRICVDLKRRRRQVRSTGV